MRAIEYIRINFKKILKESLWMFFILVLSVGLANASAGGQFFGDNPVKYISILILLSIPGGIGSHLINKRLFKKKK
jgi:hypothetical protein